MVSLIEQLVPKPQEYAFHDGQFAVPDRMMIHLTDAAQAAYLVAQHLQILLMDRGFDAEITAIQRDIDAPHVALHLAPESFDRRQGYEMIIMPTAIHIRAGDAAGLFYGAQTLAQLLTVQQGLQRAPDAPLALPAMRIKDWPDFPNRGVMLDVSRDRVPTMETLYELVDLLAGWKINQLQLYMEHTFAYRGHEVVWKDASPFTGEEILALDAYCRDQFVTLVPNQNSFGHMHRWLMHDPYHDLAECPDGYEIWPGHSGEPFSLCPIDPGSIELLEDLYDQLLPHFSSGIFNVGLDETLDVGKGRSAQVAEERGTERVYLDFLKQVYRLVRARGKTMQFWGDIIIGDPELIPELPQDAIAMEWGYEAAHPFAEHTQLFAAAGLSFYVCPGTSSWNTLAGRTDNALGNIQGAAQHGAAAGAIGLLNTDWGDSGHLQPLPISYLGYMAGAAAGWNAGTDLTAIDLPAMLDHFAFFDRAGVMGRVAYDLGNVYQLPGAEPPNASVLFLLLINPERPLDDPRLQGISRDGLAGAIQRIAELREQLAATDMARADGDLIIDEFAWAADMLTWGAQLGIARLEHDAAASAADLPEPVRAKLADDLRGLIDRHRELWLHRSRPGGLQDSVAQLQRVLNVVQS